VLFIWKELTRTERAAIAGGLTESRARWDRAQSSPFLWLRK